MKGAKAHPQETGRNPMPLHRFVFVGFCLVLSAKAQDLEKSSTAPQGGCMKGSKCLKKNTESIRLLQKRALESKGGMFEIGEIETKQAMRAQDERGKAQKKAKENRQKRRWIAKLKEAKEKAKEALEKIKARAKEELEKTKTKTKEALEKANAKAKEALEKTKAKTKEALEKAKAKAKEALEKAKAKAKEALEKAKARAKELLEKAKKAAEKCVGDCQYCTPHGEIDTNVFNDMPLCADGEYQWACVSGGHGPRVQCPAVAPIMCAYKRCDGDQDYCCEVDCGDAGSEPFGGPRLCDTREETCKLTREEIRAKCGFTGEGSCSQMSECLKKNNCCSDQNLKEYLAKRCKPDTDDDVCKGAWQ